MAPSPRSLCADRFVADEHLATQAGRCRRRLGGRIFVPLRSRSRSCGLSSFRASAVLAPPAGVGAAPRRRGPVRSCRTGPSTISPSRARGVPRRRERERAVSPSISAATPATATRLKYRQVTVLNRSETGSKTLDVRTATFESATARASASRPTRRCRACPARTSTETADVHDGAIADPPAADRRPKSVSVAAEPLFPTEHIKRLIELGRAGTIHACGQGLRRLGQRQEGLRHPGPDRPPHRARAGQQGRGGRRPTIPNWPSSRAGR